MATTRFDDWEGEYLAHFRTKGSKNGVRRYQQEDGTWTPLGLRERKAREGWGDGDERSTSRAEKKAAKAEAKAEKKAARTAAIAKAAEQRRKSNPKSMTDEELEKAINRKKMELEYKELNRSPILKTAENLVSSYIKAKDEKLKRTEREKQMEINETRAKADLLKAKAENKKYVDSMIDNFTNGAKKKEAKASLKKAKNEERKHTIRGAISESIGNIFRKEGNRFVKEMKDDSTLMSGGRFVKKLFKSTGTAVKNRATDVVEGVKEGYKQGRKEASEERSNSFNVEEYDRKARKRLGL